MSTLPKNKRIKRYFPSNPSTPSNPFIPFTASTASMASKALLFLLPGLAKVHLPEGEAGG